VSTTKYHNTIGQNAIEKAVYQLIDSLAYTTEPETALRAVFARLCDNDRPAVRDVYGIATRLHDLFVALEGEAHDMAANYQDAIYELRDNPDSLSLLRDPSGAGGASDDGSSSLPSSVAALPPAVRLHLVRRHDRVTGEDRRALRRLCEDGHGSLAAALVAEQAARNLIADSNASAAGNAGSIIDGFRDEPLAILGQGEYRREIGGGR
jgi:hypothetical protein